MDRPANSVIELLRRLRRVPQSWADLQDMGTRNEVLMLVGQLVQIPGILIHIDRYGLSIDEVDVPVPEAAIIQR
jgi:hypothetical protein